MGRKKTDLIVDPSYLYRFALYVTAVALCGALLTSLIIWFYFHVKPGVSYAEDVMLISRIRGEIVYSSFFIYVTNALFIAAAAVIMSVLYSHRIAGPVRSLEMVVARAATGDLSRDVDLRRSDVIHPLAGDVNAMVSSYRTIVSQLEEKTGELNSASHAMNNAGTLSRDEMDKALLRISEKAAEIRKILHAVVL